MKRRTYLTLGGAGIGGIAGCLFGGQEETPGESTAAPSASSATPGESTATPTESSPESQGTVEFRENLVFTNSVELSAIAENATRGFEPWASAWDVVNESADKALDGSLQSITDDDSDHRFRKDENERHDYRTTIELGDAARNLGLAYFVTGRDEYAQRTVDILFHWSLNPDTYMEPYAGSGDIEQFITIPKFFMAASLVRGHPAWETKKPRTPWKQSSSDSPQDAESAYQTWIRDWATSVESTYNNNIYIWWLVAEGAAWSYLRNRSKFAETVDRYRARRAWNDYHDCTSDRAGLFEREIRRDEPFGYQLWRMKAHIYFCELARHRGFDLYSYTAPTDSCDGSSLRASLDAMVPYIRDPDRWDFHGKSVDGKEVDENRRHKAPSIYELAYSRWEDPTYLEMIQLATDRPIDGTRILGWVTFTHGNLFEL